MDLTIMVKDSAGAPVVGATAVGTATGVLTQGVSDRQGRLVLAGLPTTASGVVVTHASYLDEQVDLLPPVAGGSFTWDNPVCSFTPPATLEVRLSRLRSAATHAMSNKDLEQQSAFDPQSAFTWIDDSGNPSNRYLGTFNGRQQSFTAVTHPLLPDKPSDGWGRVNHEASPADVDPSRNGDLVWLEWGLGRPEPRLSLGVWIPRFRGTTPSQLDFIIFFSPNTGISDYPIDTYPWLDKYPYWAQKGSVPLRGGGPLPLVQPYIALTQRYLFFEKWLVQQLMAAKRQAIVVFPVQPYGNWGPFAEVAGLARLVSEITHFMHRTGRTRGGNSDNDEDRAPRPGYRSGRLGIHQPAPTARRIVLSGFSAGVGPVASMLGTQIGQRLQVPSMTHELFGADVAPFLGAWREVWDHDAPADVRNKLDTDLPGWLRQNSDRMARCYQTDHTGSRGWISSTPLAAFVPTPPKAVSAGTSDAAERHADAHCSLVFFGAGYLHHTSASKPAPPVFWTAKDDHQAVPMVTFGHAARLSGLAKS